MSEPTPPEQLTFAELHASALNTIAALLAGKSAKIDPQSILQFGYFMAALGEPEFTMRLTCGGCGHVWHEKTTKGLNTIEYPLHQYQNRACDKCGNVQWSLVIEREKKQ